MVQQRTFDQDSYLVFQKVKRAILFLSFDDVNTKYWWPSVIGSIYIFFNLVVNCVWYGIR